MAEKPPQVMPSLVFVPNLRIDRGMGHLRRCLDAAASAGIGAVIYWSVDPVLTAGHPAFERVLVQKLAEGAGVTLWDQWPQNLVIPVVVADLQSAGREVFSFLRSRSRCLVGWDLGGAARFLFPFLVDSLPHETKPGPNIRLPGLLGLKVSQNRKFDRPIQKILAVFGGADPAGLTLRFLRMVQTFRENGLWPYDLTVVRGPLSGFATPVGVKVVDSPDDLPGLLEQSDLTVTSWGMTALESLAAGTPVLLFNPTGYHERLSRKAGLPTFGVKRPRPRAFWSGLAQASPAAVQARGLIHAPVDAGLYFSGFHGSDGRCPVCRTSGHPVFARTETKSYHRCGVCGMEFLSVHQLPEKTYTDAYFFEDYQKQYGKTYLEDFAHIQNLGRQRLEFLNAHFGVLEGRTILDVGCAYGPFLAAAAEAGYRPFGLDIAEGAVNHVRQELKIPAVCASFTDFRWNEAFPGQPAPEAVTLWYVIEHFPDLAAVLRKANELLPAGGILAFSTPNGHGITRTFQPVKFWRESPDDHFSIWNPTNARTVLKRFGFEAVSFRITGRHPERFPGLNRASGFFYGVVAFLDRCFGWGDTFEVYARKIKELP